MLIYICSELRLPSLSVTREKRDMGTALIGQKNPAEIGTSSYFMHSTAHRGAYSNAGDDEHGCAGENIKYDVECIKDNNKKQNKGKRKS